MSTTKQVWLINSKGIWGLKQVHTFTYSLFYPTKVHWACTLLQHRGFLGPPNTKETANLMLMIWQPYFPSRPHVTSRTGSDPCLLKLCHSDGARNCRQVCPPQCAPLYGRSSLPPAQMPWNLRTQKSEELICHKTPWGLVVEISKGTHQKLTSSV